MWQLRLAAFSHITKQMCGTVRHWRLRLRERRSYTTSRPRIVTT